MNLYELDKLIESLRNDSLGLGRNDDLIEFYMGRRKELILMIKEKIDKELGMNIGTKTIDMVKGFSV